jgi:hypothetical protein
VSAAPGLEMFRVPDIVERVTARGLLINGDLTHAYFCNTAVANPEQLISTALVITETSGDRLSVIDYTNYILYRINRGI